MQRGGNTRREFWASSRLLGPGAWFLGSHHQIHGMQDAQRVITDRSEELEVKELMALELLCRWRRSPAAHPTGIKDHWRQCWRRNETHQRVLDHCRSIGISEGALGRTEQTSCRDAPALPPLLEAGIQTILVMIWARSSALDEPQASGFPSPTVEPRGWTGSGAGGSPTTRVPSLSYLPPCSQRQFQQQLFASSLFKPYVRQP